MRVLISGAGIAGPALACCLAKTGSRITLVEKSNAILPYGQNIDLDGSALTAMKHLGLLDEVRKFNTGEKGTQFIDSKGRPFAQMPQTGNGTASPTSEFEILRGDLSMVLYHASKDLQNVHYLLGTTIKGVLSNGDSNVKVELSNGDVQEFDLLVVADGQWSRLRKQLFTPESVKVVDLGMYAVYWTIPRLPSDNDWWNIYQALGSRVISLRPDPYGTTRAMFGFMPCNDTQKQAWQDASRSDRKIQKELLKMEFGDAGWQAQRLLDTIDQAPDFYFHDIKQVRMSKWSNSRVICLGDTAYCPTPLTGAGSTLAITGAYMLAGELSKLHDREHPSKALEAYENRFKPFVLETQSIPFFIPGVAHPRAAWQRWLFQWFVAIMARLVALPIFASKTGESNDNGFALPHYPALNVDDGGATKGPHIERSDTAQRSLWEMCKHGLVAFGRMKANRDS